MNINAFPFSASSPCGVDGMTAAAVVRPSRRTLRNRWMLLAAAGLSLLAGGASAQVVQRSFVNLGFESPALPLASCTAQIPSTLVTGWETTHPIATGGGCTFPNDTGRLIELWRSFDPGTGVVLPRAGLNHAELNAQTASRIYQTVCMSPGEPVNWRFSHRGRVSNTVPDVMDFEVGPTATGPLTLIAQTATTRDGRNIAAPSADQTGLLSCATGTCALAPTAVNGGWRDYSGTFTWAGGAGLQTFGFRADRSAGGIASLGNFVDDIDVVLVPYLEFDAPGGYSTAEGTTAGTPSLRLVGRVPAAISVPIVVSVVGGTASLGSDYTTPNGSANFNVSIPAGDYSEGMSFPINVTAVNDGVIENNETVVMTIGASPTNQYQIASTTSCGSAPSTTTTWTIVDNDVDLLTTKSVSTATPVAGVPFNYTVSFRNNTAAPTVAPTTAHNAVVSVADALPAGLSFGSWTCTASGGATCPGGITTGSGAISGSATLPAGAGAAGGQLVYAITATATGSPSCGAITNTSTIALAGGSPLQEGTTVQAGFVTPAPGGAANNSASADVAVRCATLQLSKNWVNAVVNDTAALSGTGGTSPATLAATANTPNEADTGVAAAVLAGNSITLAEVLGGANVGLYTPSAWSCTGTAGLAGNVLTVGPADTAIVCQLSNTRQTADLQVTKTASPAGAVRSGQTLTYTITVTNNGPAAASGAVVSDTPGVGLNCAAAVPTCTASGGASCPGSLAPLFGAGATIPVLPAGGVVNIAMQCVVN